MSQIKIEISEETLQDLIYICNGVFAPLNGFMNQDDYKNVIQNMRLESGDIWTIPITLDIDESVYHIALTEDRLNLYYQGIHIAYLENLNGFVINRRDIEKIYCTTSLEHPGVKKEIERSPFRIGGRIVLIDKTILIGQLNPESTKQIFAEKGFKTVVGFQTRNAIHKAHEYLQRTALEICDGLFINPIVGWKKKGDFTESAVYAAYDAMITKFYPKERVYFEGLRTQMRYAGPREAIFHAIIRRNLGCTHFIIGRDHAGVGNFYDVYAAHQLARQIMKTGKLGIQLLLLHEPYYCLQCGQIVTEKTCCHSLDHKLSISGTEIRNCLQHNAFPDIKLMRREISEAILSVGRENIFIK